jgi:C-terminal topoisomerase domain
MGKATLKRDKPPEKLVEATDRLEEKIKTFKLQMVDREAGKEVALGTSKINYLDPRWVALSRIPPFFLVLIRSGARRITAAWRGARSTTCRSRRYFRRRC